MWFNGRKNMRAASYIAASLKRDPSSATLTISFMETYISGGIFMKSGVIVISIGKLLAKSFNSNN